MKKLILIFILGIDSHDAVKVSDEARDLAEVVLVILVVVQRVDRVIVDIERPALNVLALNHVHHLASVDRLNAGDVSSLGRNQDAATRDAADRGRQCVVDGEAAANLCPCRYRTRWNDLGTTVRADKKLAVVAERHAVMVSVGDDDGSGIGDRHGVEID